MEKMYFSTNTKNQLIVNNLTVCSLKNKYRKMSFEEYRKTNLSKGKTLNNKITLNGKWYLKDDKRLSFRVMGAESAFLGKYIILNGNLNTPGVSQFGFRIETVTSLKNVKRHSIELKGNWVADKKNRITFRLRNSLSKQNILRLQGAWKINNKNEIIYEVSTQKNKRPFKTLTFKGYWDILPGKLIYQFGIKGNKGFVFRAKLNSKKVVKKKGEIKYSVNIEYLRNNLKYRVSRQITLKGTWTIEDVKASFIISYSGFRKKAISFIVEKMFAKKGKIILELSKEQRKNIVVKLELSKKIKEDVDLFIRLSGVKNKDKNNDFSVVGGINVRF